MSNVACSWLNLCHICPTLHAVSQTRWKKSMSETVGFLVFGFLPKTGYNQKLLWSFIIACDCSASKMLQFFRW